MSRLKELHEWIQKTFKFGAYIYKDRTHLTCIFRMLRCLLIVIACLQKTLGICVSQVLDNNLANKRWQHFLVTILHVEFDLALQLFREVLNNLTLSNVVDLGRVTKEHLHTSQLLQLFQFLNIQSVISSGQVNYIANSEILSHSLNLVSHLV